MHVTHIGRYEVIRVLGKGAMGVVYEARDPRLARAVAVKTIRAEARDAAQAAAYEARFQTEARSVARLNHPNIVSVFDSGQSEDTTYLVMELVTGVNLKPENILLDAKGWVKLTDFGIAKILDIEDDNGTQVSGHSIGTPRYMSAVGGGEPCKGLGFFERESCLWKQCLLEAYRSLPVCERFQSPRPGQ